MKLSKFALLVCVLLACTACGKALESAAKVKEKVALQAMINEGQRLHDQGQSRAAIAKFEVVVAHPLANDAQKAGALRYLSLGHYELGEYTLSGDYAAKAAAYYPKDSYDYLVNMADADLMHDQVPKAIERLQQAVTLNPREMTAHNVLGLVYLGDNGAQYIDYPKALEHNQKAFKISPGRISEVVLVRSYLKLGDYPSALEHLHSLHKRFPDDGRINELLDKAEAGLAGEKP